MHANLFDTAFGVCGIAWSDTGLMQVQLPEATGDATRLRLERAGATVSSDASPACARDAITALRAYFDGTVESFDAVLLDDWQVSPFHQTVYRLLRQVPFGQTVTYGELAKSAGQPGGARAVGLAMGRNPWPVIVPCHRVLASGGKLGGFSAHGGTMTKERLLALEGVVVGDPMLPGLF